MAMIRCSECRKKVSTKAATCPSCGSPVELKSGHIATGWGCLIIIAVTVGLWVSGTSNMDRRGDPPRTQLSNRQPTSKLTRKTPPHVSVPIQPIDASGIGLRGILPVWIPSGLRRQSFETLGETWADWSDEVHDELERLYEQEGLTLEEQKASLAKLRKKLDTMQVALGDVRYRAIHAQVSSIYGRLSRRVHLAAAILQTLDFDSSDNFDARIVSAHSGVIDALESLEDWLTDDVPKGRPWLDYVEADEIRAIPPENDSTKLMSVVLDKLVNRDPLDSPAQREFLRSPKFVELSEQLEAYIVELGKKQPKFDEERVRELLAALVQATERWEADSDSNSVSRVNASLSELEENFGASLDSLARLVRETYSVENIAPANNFLDSPSMVMQVIAEITAVPTSWKKSRVADGGWVLSPLGAGVDLAPAAGFIQPNLSIFAFGSGPSRVDRITVKLNMNGSSRYELMRPALIDAANKLLALNGHALSGPLSEKITNTVSVPFDRSAKQSPRRLLHRDQMEYFTVDLFEETGSLTTLIVEVARMPSAAQVVADPQKPTPVSRIVSVDQRLRTMKTWFESIDSTGVLVEGVTCRAIDKALIVTVTNEWHRQPYQERLQVAQIIEKKWKSVTGSAVGIFHLNDRLGNEVGGRGFTGVWVQESK